MSNSYHNPPGLFPPYANYAHAVETPPNSRTLYVSGLSCTLLEPEWLIEIEAVAARVD
jgi:enamine deaminase RidA (YjgF/YER057c/UK114 family)